MLKFSELTYVPDKQCINCKYCEATTEYIHVFTIPTPQMLYRCEKNSWYITHDSPGCPYYITKESTFFQ